MNRNRETERLSAYHEFTKHTPEKLRRTAHALDWENMPNPYREYAAVRVLEPPEQVSTLLLHSAAISARKKAPSGQRYALRVNPSSGNLHPTEFHFFARGLPEIADGLYHYRVSSHQLEQRARGNEVPSWFPAAPLVFILTSIAWREAWKYRDRAYRYCLLDIGHAWGALAAAAAKLGWKAHAFGEFPDNELMSYIDLRDEWPMLLVALEGMPIEPRPRHPLERPAGIPNRLSAQEVEYPLIDAIHEASKLTDPTARELAVPSPSPTEWPAIRRRRSALDFLGGDRTISRAQLEALLAVERRYIRLFLFIHRVEGLDPGLYDEHFQLLKPGDQRLSAAALSLSQDLAGNSCVTFSMIADLPAVAARFGNRGYRYAFFEAGAIGQHLYLTAESLGFQATGIGAFFDDAVHRHLNLGPDDGQVVYHFACGFAVPDHRLQSE